MAGLRALAFGVVWWVLADGDPASWPFGIALVATAVVASFLVADRDGTFFTVIGTVRLISLFVARSFIGAVDVAWRALHPGLALDPTIVAYRLRLPMDRGRVFFANAVSLLPGTLSAELTSETLLVHVLDRSRPFENELRALEARVGHLYGHAVGESTGAE